MGDMSEEQRRQLEERYLKKIMEWSKNLSEDERQRLHERREEAGRKYDRQIKRWLWALLVLVVAYGFFIKPYVDPNPDLLRPLSPMEEWLFFGLWFMVFFVYYLDKKIRRWRGRL